MSKKRVKEKDVTFGATNACVSPGCSVAFTLLPSRFLICAKGLSLVFPRYLLSFFLSIFRGRPLQRYFDKSRRLCCCLFLRSVLLFLEVFFPRSRQCHLCRLERCSLLRGIGLKCCRPHPLLFRPRGFSKTDALSLGPCMRVYVRCVGSL